MPWWLLLYYNYVFHELSGNIKEKEKFIGQQGILRVVPSNSFLYNSVLLLENPETRIVFFKICRKQWFTENQYTLWSCGREHNPSSSLSTTTVSFENLNWTKVATLKRSVHLNNYNGANASGLLPQYHLHVDHNYHQSITLNLSENYHLLTAKTSKENPPFFTYHSLIGPIGKGGGLLTITSPNWIFATAICTLILAIQEEIYNGKLIVNRPTNIDEMQKLVQKYWNGENDGGEREKAVERDVLDEKVEGVKDEEFNLVVNLSVGRVGKEWKADVEGVVVLKKDERGKGKE